MSPKKDTPKTAKGTGATRKKSKGFTDEERAAMKERKQELKAATRAGSAADGERATLGFSDHATLDEGALWPTGFALKELTSAAAGRISALVKKAVS